MVYQLASYRRRRAPYSKHRTRSTRRRGARRSRAHRSRAHRSRARRSRAHRSRAHRSSHRTSRRRSRRSGARRSVRLPYARGLTDMFGNHANGNTKALIQTIKKLDNNPKWEGKCILCGGPHNWRECKDANVLKEKEEINGRLMFKKDYFENKIKPHLPDGFKRPRMKRHKKTRSATRKSVKGTSPKPQVAPAS